jgi:hypothetical protein
MLNNPESAAFQAALAVHAKLSRQYISGSASSSFDPFAAMMPRPTTNVVAVGIGPAEVKGKLTEELAIKLFVERKFSRDELSEEDLLPNQVDNVRIDVVESGRIIRHIDPKQRFRPVQPGCSIGYADPTGQTIMAGTLGAIVTDGADQFLLSNNHVLADQNNLPIGSPIFQPGLLDHGRNPTDRVADLSQFVPLSLSGNTVDCAIAKVDDPKSVSNKVLQIGAPSGTVAAALGLAVQKFGRTTSYTKGTITSIHTSVQVGYEMGTLTFSDQIIIAGDNGSAFSNAGDSGSLILDMNNQAVGLLFAGSTATTIANPIANVLAALNVKLV